MKETKLAPWTVEEVELLNDEQVAGRVHPYTCGQCRDNLGTRFYGNDDGSTRQWIALDDLAVQTAGPVRKKLLTNKFIHRERALVATLNGWICPTCDYTQNYYVSFS